MNPMTWCNIVFKIVTFAGLIWTNGPTDCCCWPVDLLTVPNGSQCLQTPWSDHTSQTFSKSVISKCNQNSTRLYTVTRCAQIQITETQRDTSSRQDLMPDMASVIEYCSFLGLASLGWFWLSSVIIRLQVRLSLVQIQIGLSSLLPDQC